MSLVDLEHRLKNSNAAESQSSKSPASSLEEELIGTGRFEQLPPQPMIDELYVVLHFELARV